MSQTFWESEVAEEPQPEQIVTEPQAEAPAPPPQTSLEEQHPEPVSEPVADSGALAVSGDEFFALEERILRTVSLLKRERQTRAEAEERATKAEVQLREQAPLVEHLQKELNVLRAERDNVRQRVERLLSQLDALEL